MIYISNATNNSGIINNNSEISNNNAEHTINIAGSVNNNIFNAITSQYFLN